MMRLSLSVFLSVVLVSVPIAGQTGAPADWSNSTYEQSLPEPPPLIAEPLTQDPEEFRLQMLDFLAELEAALKIALQHPTVGASMRMQLNPLEQKAPVPEELYDMIRTAGTDDLLLLRDALALSPGFFSAPVALKRSLSQLPPPDERDSRRESCGDEYEEDSKISRLVTALTVMEYAHDGAEIIAVFLGDLDSLVDAVTGEPEIIPPACVQVPTSWIQIAFVIFAGLADITVQLLDGAVAELEYAKDQSEFCIDLCAPQGFAEHHRMDTNNDLEGRGCDNRDNNCTGGIDEIAEDRFDPIVTIDSALTSQCYRDAVTAETAAALAIKARDDCVTISETPAAQEGELRVIFNYSPFPICRGVLTAVARDLKGNQTIADATMTIDEESPQITLPDMDECYATMAAAQQALTDPAAGFGIIDCTAVEFSVSAVEKECVADFEVEAVDECGNRQFAESSVRVDSSPPDIDIERLLLPEVDGRICFASREDAVDTVHEAIRFSDDCSTAGNLTVSTEIEPGTCDLEVISTAEDQCSLSNSDSIEVRVDAEPPFVACSVERPLLWPADDELVDVGLQITAHDNCDGDDPHVDVFVTSDETTTYLYPVHGSGDPGPDAVIERDSSGDVERVLLRAQRRQTTAYDGRVYRIRVVATDGCGLSSRTDCYVTVPKTYSGGNGRGTVGNSGQFHDATIVN